MICTTCMNVGYVDELVRVDTRAEHHEQCDEYTCSTSCPVPVPAPIFKRAPCPDCEPGCIHGPYSMVAHVVSCGTMKRWSTGREGGTR